MKNRLKPNISPLEIEIERIAASAYLYSIADRTTQFNIHAKIQGNRTTDATPSAAKSQSVINKLNQ